MELRAGDGLLLHQQARANFDFSTDAEWVDALISDRLHCVRPNYLPMIILGGLIHFPNGLAVSGEAEQVEMPVVAEIRDREDRCGSDWTAQRCEGSIFVTEPDERSVASDCG